MDRLTSMELFVAVAELGTLNKAAEKLEISNAAATRHITSLENRLNVRLIERMLPMLEKNGVILSLENIYGAAYGEAHHSAAEDMLYYAEYFRSPYVGICLDTGHAVIRGQDPSAMLRKTAPYLTALHAHTTVPGMDLHTIPCTVGQKIKWTEIAQILKESPYKGTFNMEIKPPSQLSEAASVLFYQLAYRIARDLLGEE